MLLDEDAVRRLLRMEDLIPAMERALADLSAGKVVQPVRLMLPVSEHQGFFATMPACTERALGAKVVTFYPAVSAVATHRLARADASVLAILGSGVQAGSHLEALRLVRGFREVRVWSPRHAGAFAERFGVRAAGSAAEAVRGADTVVVATSSRTPVLRGEWLSAGTHVNAVGACRPDWRELDDAAVRRGRLFVESREAAIRESGDVIAAGEVVGEIGEVIAGTRPGRQTAEEVTLFKSVGVAVEDVVAADMVYRSATTGDGLQ
jgi:ornithine cyclodeaminase/alanine dehydrogenase-like protein (mu-crystallin family)